MKMGFSMRPKLGTYTIGDCMALSCTVGSSSGRQYVSFAYSLNEGPKIYIGGDSIRTSSSETTLTVKFTPTQSGEYSIYYTGGETTDPSLINHFGGKFTWSINSAPTAPTWINYANGNVQAGIPVNINWGGANDPDGNQLSYEVYYCRNGNNTLVYSSNGTSCTYLLPQENTDAYFAVRASDGKVWSGFANGATFHVFTNSAPTISGNANENLGNKNTAFSVSYSVNDVNTGNVLNVVEKLNGNQINSIANAPRNTDFNINITKAMLESLPLNQQSSIQISVTDGFTTTYKTFSFTRVNNGPIISNTSKDLGVINNVTEKYICHDVEGNTFNVIEKIDDIEIKTFNGVEGTEYTTDIPKSIWFKLINGQHTYTIAATDSLGARTIRTFTFTKKETVIESEGLTNIVQTDAAATKILLTPNWSGKENADILFEVCNNAFDTAPTWENATNQTLVNKPYIFTNKVKTDAKWGIDIRFKLTLKENVTDGIELYGIGGAFE